MRFIVTPSLVQDSAVTVPGDKSISHRALMLGGIAEGRSNVSGFLAGDDCLATMTAMRALGVRIEQTGETDLVVDGVGADGLQAAPGPLDLGNAGTAIRLLTGLLCGRPFDSVLTGDASLRSRPMQRVITPLKQMGARIRSRDGRPPLEISGQAGLVAIDYALPVASAQVKSAVLLAALGATGETCVTEPAVTRDHTERMLQTLGVRLSVTGRRICVAGGQRLAGTSVRVPGDLSSAAFPMLAAILSKDAELLIRDVGVNPTRTGVLEILRAMGADIVLTNERCFGTEPVADLRVRASRLAGGRVDPALVSLAIDEFPVLFVAAAAARGKTEFSGIGELRVKESDRIASMAAGLRALGIEVDETSDGATVAGGRFRAGCVASHGDHRVAMALAVAATIADGPVQIDDVAPVATSFPDFAGHLRGIGVDIRIEQGACDAV